MKPTFTEAGLLKCLPYKFDHNVGAAKQLVTKGWATEIKGDSPFCLSTFQITKKGYDALRSWYSE